MSGFDFKKKIFGSGLGLAFKSQSKMVQMCMIATLVASGFIVSQTGIKNILEDRMGTTIQALEETGHTHGFSDILTISARANELFEAQIAQEPDSLAKETISLFFNTPEQTQEVANNENANGAYGNFLQEKIIKTIGYVENGANENGAYGEYLSEKKSKSPSIPSL